MTLCGSVCKQGKQLPSQEKICSKIARNFYLSVQNVARQKEMMSVFNVGIVRQNKLECGPMPNVMVALPNIGGALCSTPQSLADAHY